MTMEGGKCDAKELKGDLEALNGDVKSLKLMGRS